VSVAMVVLVLAVVPIVGMLEVGLRAATSSGEYDAARALANEKLEEVRALPYSRSGGVADSAVERYAPPGQPDVTEGDFSISVRPRSWTGISPAPRTRRPQGKCAWRCSWHGTPGLTRPSGSCRGSRREAPVGPAERLQAT
jgi:hypothetical protein